MKGIAYMEALVRPLSWAEWSDSATPPFQGSMRSPAGEEMVLEKNFFIERILPASIIRTLRKRKWTNIGDRLPNRVRRAVRP